MNIHEGSRRMQRAGQWMMVVPIGLVLLIWVIELAQDLGRGRGLADFGFRFPLIFTALPLLVPGAALWIAGWIVEGFNQDGH